MKPPRLKEKKSKKLCWQQPQQKPTSVVCANSPERPQPYYTQTQSCQTQLGFVVCPLCPAGYPAGCPAGVRRHKQFEIPKLFFVSSLLLHDVPLATTALAAATTTTTTTTTAAAATTGIAPVVITRAAALGLDTARLLHLGRGEALRLAHTLRQQQDLGIIVMNTNILN